MTGDGAKAELVEANKVIGLKDQQIGLLNQKDSLKEQKITNLTLMFDKATQQRDLEREKADGLLKELKVQKFKTAVYKAGTGAAIITTVLYLLKK